ncbi:hypothetical protein JZ751_017328 [Albula glossodonta]|uniref:Uncharacterized protein n=1 Tax=Albula glossodonta TaxID=121402 RepID=A0A8T2PNE4_9TELE|nr:hypothetical protein JZ751_017328 [Albula glossodonta]
MRSHPLLHQHRQKGVGQMDQGGADWPAKTYVSWHQVDLQQWEQQLWLLCGAAGAADSGQPPDQAASPDPQLSLHGHPG